MTLQTSASAQASAWFCCNSFSLGQLLQCCAVVCCDVLLCVCVSHAVELAGVGRAYPPVEVCHQAVGVVGH
jgi:hypothetical protein